MKAITLLSKNEDALNIWLIGFSLILAFILPFSLFLFSYAVLGPLHYMTEINWLNEKRYFVKNYRWVALLAICALCISVPAMAHLPVFTEYMGGETLNTVTYTLADYADIILFGLILFAIALVFFEKWWHVLLLFPFSLLLSKLVLQHVFGSFIVVGIFLPTIIHVYVFTLLFMLLGAMNSRRKEGYISVILLLLTPFAILTVDIDPSLYALTESGQAMHTARNFRFLNYIADLFGSAENGRIVSLSSIGLKIQTFIAFAYTYHYLNWFSKVSTIGWRKNISKRKVIAIAIIWLASIGLFLYDYEIAYLALFFMAILHIVLEFPLNVVCMRAIGQKLMVRGRAGKKSGTAL